MNDPRDPRTKLLAETLHGDWADGPAAAMARRAATHARRRRALKRASLSLAVAATVGVAIFTGNQVQRPVTPRPVPVAQLGYEIISDDELMAQLKDRPLLVLPQANGSKKFVVLDR